MHIMEGFRSGQWGDSARARKIFEINGMPFRFFPFVVRRDNPPGNRINGYRLAAPATTRGGVRGFVPGYRRDQKTKGSTPGIR